MSRSSDPDAPASRVALVVGASSGIGAATAARLHAAGYAVAAMSRSGTGPPGTTGITGDITDRDSLARALAQVEIDLGSPEVIVVAAGATAVRPLLLTGEGLLDELLSVNLAGPWRIVRAMAPAMIRKGRGRILFVSSLSGLFGAPGQVAYATAKAALTDLARDLAAELGPHGITVNTVVPGFVDTPMTAGLPAGHRERLAAASPRGRAASADEIAEVIVFLAGAGGAAVNGAILMADGGESACRVPDGVLR